MTTRYSFLTLTFATLVLTGVSYGGVRDLNVVTKENEIVERAEESSSSFEIALLEHKNRVYVEGEFLEFEFIAPVSGFVEIDNVGASGKRIRLVPSSDMSEPPKVKVGERIKFPHNDKYKLQVNAPFGAESIIVYITQTPWKEIPQKTAGRFSLIEDKDYSRRLDEIRTLQAQPGTRGMTVGLDGTISEGVVPPVMVGRVDLTTISRSQLLSSAIATIPVAETPRPEGAPYDSNRAWSRSFGVDFLRFGFNVGVSTQKDGRGMEACAKDAELYDALERDSFGVVRERRITLVGNSATKANIKEQLGSICNAMTSHAYEQRGKILYFTFSGHGESIDGVNYLIPADGDVADVATMISEKELSDWLRPLDQKNCYVVIFLDACYSGGFSGKDDYALVGVKSGRGLVSEPDEFLSFMETEIVAREEEKLYDVGFSALQKCGIYILCSSTASQESYVRPDGKSSVFTGILVDVLQKSFDHVTQIDLMPAISSEIQSYVSEHVRASAIQQPTELDKLGGNLFLKDVRVMPPFDR